MVLNHIVNRGKFLESETSLSNNQSNNSRDEEKEDLVESSINNLNNLSTLEERLIKTSPLLEAFGNAKSKKTSFNSLNTSYFLF